MWTYPKKGCHFNYINFCAGKIKRFKFFLHGQNNSGGYLEARARKFCKNVIFLKNITISLDKIATLAEDHFIFF